MGNNEGEKTASQPGKDPAQPKPQKESKAELPNSFQLEDLYPDAAGLIAAPFISLDDAKRDAVFVLDTNVLLVPYEIGPRTFDEIARTYEQLVKEKRLRIPGRVAREFVKNRAAKITELYQQFKRRRDWKPFEQGSRPMLTGDDKYKRLVDVEGRLEKVFEEYQKAVDDVLDRIQEWNWNDPASALYRRLLPAGIVVESSKPREQIAREHKERFAALIPPGYKDRGKDDEGIGDFLVWLAILEVGGTEKRNVIFVSGEQKADWWHRGEGRSLFPRFELVDEFRRTSGGRSFHIIKFSVLLEMFGASKEAVKEVSDEEAAAAARRAADFEATLTQEQIGRMLVAARDKLATAFSRVESLPSDAANYNVALPLGRAWHNANRQWVEAQREAQKLERLLSADHSAIERIRQLDAAGKYTGIPCSRCGHPTMGSGGAPNCCGNCGFVSEHE